MQSSLEGHWLAGQLEQLDRLADETDAAKTGGDESVVRTARDTFMRAIDRFANNVSERPGVSGCVVAHEGLVLAQAGTASAETLAAVSQVWMLSAIKGAEQLALGEMSQMLVVGDQQKVALFRTGDMFIAILAPRGANLTQSMAR